jgi:hypothetical protein
MLYQVGADALVLLHLVFILFVVLGGLLVAKWPRLAWLHLPALLWGVVIEFSGAICPLTPLENRLRQAAGGDGYPGSFIQHYLLPVIYPAEFSRELQVLLGVLVLALNLMVYAVFLARRRGPTPGGN